MPERKASEGRELVASCSLLPAQAAAPPNSPGYPQNIPGPGGESVRRDTNPRRASEEAPRAWSESALSQNTAQSSGFPPVLLLGTNTYTPLFKDFWAVLLS